MMFALVGPALVGAALLGCQATSGAAATALANTAIAATASGISRASGGCYANCPTGTTCNPKTGLCDEVPCRGRCAPGEVCDEKALFPSCKPSQTPPLEIEAK
jgi:hypothetical protein